MSEGWICPRCGKAWAPWVAQCDCTERPWQVTCEGTGTFPAMGNKTITTANPPYYSTICKLCTTTCKDSDGLVRTSCPPKLYCKKYKAYRQIGEPCIGYVGITSVKVKVENE